jgi:hypothetical protein
VILVLLVIIVQRVPVAMMINHALQVTTVHLALNMTNNTHVLMASSMTNYMAKAY